MPLKMTQNPRWNDLTTFLSSFSSFVMMIPSFVQSVEPNTSHNKQLFQLRLSPVLLEINYFIMELVGIYKTKCTKRQKVRKEEQSVSSKLLKFTTYAKLLHHSSWFYSLKLTMFQKSNLLSCYIYIYMQLSTRQLLPSTMEIFSTSNR